MSNEMTTLIEWGTDWRAVLSQRLNVEGVCDARLQGLVSLISSQCALLMQTKQLWWFRFRMIWTHCTVTLVSCHRAAELEYEGR